MSEGCPILFLIFNRPNVTRRVFERIRLARPVRLYVASDGAREGKIGEAEKVTQAREIATDVDWPCEVKTLFRPTNLGCKQAVSQAISWFFDNEEMGIVLEDDCLPEADFFYFCQKLLLRYANDSRIGQICGSSFAEKIEPDIYAFSRYGPIWGWASWRRAWVAYDVDVREWPIMRTEAYLDSAYPSPEERKHKLGLGDRLYAAKIDTWDHQWGMAKNFNNMLSIVPRTNLISNIGFHSDATHTTSGESVFPPVGKLSKVWRHPRFICANAEYDKLYLKKSLPSEFLLRRLIRVFMPKTMRERLRGK